MSIFSASPSISGSFSTARVSYSSASCSRISRISCGFSVRRSRRHCPCTIYASNVRAMGGLVEDKRASVLALGLGSQQEVGHSRVFLDVRSEEGEYSASASCSINFPLSCLLDLFFIS